MSEQLDNLTAKQRLFVAEYAKDTNATQAALRAGYSEKSAAVEGTRLLKNAKVAAEIAKVQAKATQRAEISAEMVLRELAILAGSNVEHYQTTDDGRLTVKEGVPPEAMRAVSSVKIKTRQGPDGKPISEVEYKLWDKPASLNMLGKHLALFIERIDHTSKGNAIAPVLVTPPPVTLAEWQSQVAALHEAARLTNEKAPPLALEASDGAKAEGGGT